MLSLESKLKKSFLKGTLLIKSVSSTGQVEWKRVMGVTRSDIGSESIHKLTTEVGSMVLTGGHRVFVTPVEKVEPELLREGDYVLGFRDGNVSKVKVLSNEPLPSRKYMYDLTAEDWHNFTTVGGNVVISNSPDRNYHFRPPTHEATISQFNKVFGYIWENEELNEYIARSLDMVVAAPPRTPFANVDQMVQIRPEWRTVLLTGAMIFALQALEINWVAEDFSVKEDTLVRIILPDDSEVDLTIRELYDICYG